MSSKKFKGKTCVFCCIPGSSECPDHVVARSFFLDRKRGDLPQVPACRSCNKTKSDLEHYLETVSVFGATHMDAHETIETFARRRLERNEALRLELAAGIKKDAGEMTVPFRGEKLRTLYEYIARGLAYWHWQLLLPLDACTVHAEFLIAEGAEKIEHLMCSAANRHIDQNLGDGVFRYHGTQASDVPDITLWRMSSLYGGRVADGSQVVELAYVITGPKRLSALNELIARLRQPVIEQLMSSEGA
jgi:hypothetical protein